MFDTFVTTLLPFVPKKIVHLVAKRYVAGDSLGDAVLEVKKLNQSGAEATIDVLGEFVKERKQVELGRKHDQEVIRAIAKNQLRAGISVKLTSLGLDLDEQYCFENLKSILSLAHEQKQFVCIDMENSPYTSKTLGLYEKCRKEGFDQVGVVIQARLFRSEEDLKALARHKATVRLCKGIYLEPSEIAHQDADAIRNAYKKHLTFLLKNEMFAAIATHDDELIDDACSQIKKLKIDKSMYEFQMLLGVREEKRKSLIQAGHPLRVYVPFGADWYGYSLRRLKENPQIAMHVLKAMFKI